jgi:hypothetical protein
MSDALRSEVSRLTTTLRLIAREAQTGVQVPHLAYNACCEILETLDYTFTAQRDGETFEERVGIK